MSPLIESIEIFKEMVVLYEQYKIPITFSKYAQVLSVAVETFLLHQSSTAFVIHVSCPGQSFSDCWDAVELAVSSH